MEPASVSPSHRSLPPAFEPRHDFFLHLIIVVELLPSQMLLWVKKQVEIAGRESQQQFVCEFPLDVRLLR